jgi:hypothetical protein
VGSEQYLTVQATGFGFLALAMVFTERWLASAPARISDRRTFLSCAAGIGILTLTFALHVHANARQDEHFAADYGRLVLETLPPDAALLVWNSTDTGPIAYVHHLEGIRPDVKLYSQLGALFPNRLFHPYKDTLDERVSRLSSWLADQPNAFFTFASPLLIMARSDVGSDDAVEFVNVVGDHERRFVPSEHILDELEEMLDRELLGVNPLDWTSHKERILSSVCESLIAAGRFHPAIERLPYCAFAYGSQLYRDGRLSEARSILHRLLTTASTHDLTVRQWHLAHLRHLDAVLALHEQGQRVSLQGAVDLAKEGVGMVEGCQNRIAPLLARVHQASGGKIEVGLRTISRRWGDCPGVIAALRGEELELPSQRAPSEAALPAP